MADINENAKKPSIEELIPKMWPPLTTVYDRHGNKIQYGRVGDYWHAPFPLGPDMDYSTHAELVRNFEMRDDDVLICSYPKTGMNWHYEIVQMLLKKEASPTMDNYLAGFLDARPIKTVDQLPSPRVLCMHMPFRHLPKQALEKKIKIIHLDRNPKDVMVSFYHFMKGHEPPCHFPGTFPEFVDLCLEVGYLYGGLFDYSLGWQEGIEQNPDVPMLVSMFEDMKLDPVSNVKQLNDYLGTGCSDALCEEIARACVFRKLKDFRDANRPEITKLLFKKDSAGIYRKGMVGDWKNYFTVAMNERFDKEYKRRMSKYKTKYIFTE